MTYFDDYDDYDDYYEPNPEEEYFDQKYKLLLNSFLQKYESMPLQQNTVHFVSRTIMDLKDLPYEPKSIKMELIKDSVRKIRNPEIRKKFMTEVFLLQFKGLKLKDEPKKFLKILYEKETIEIALLAWEAGSYSFIMEFIVTVLEHVKPTIKKTIPQSLKNQDEDDMAEMYSDVLYWEAVHDGEIVPDENDNSSNDFDDFDDYDYYDFKDDRYDNEKYNNPEKIAIWLQPYMEVLEKESSHHIQTPVKKAFLNRFVNHSYDAKRILKEIERKEYFQQILPELRRTGKELGLIVQVSENYEWTIEFLSSEGNRYIEFTMYHMIDDKEDWGGNTLSLFINDIENNYTIRDLTNALKILQAIGYKINNDYIDYAKKATRLKDFNKVIMRLPSGLKIEMINRYNEMMQSLKWKDI